MFPIVTHSLERSLKTGFTILSTFILHCSRCSFARYRNSALIVSIACISPALNQFTTIEQNSKWNVLFCVLVCFRDPEGLRTFYCLVQDLSYFVYLSVSETRRACGHSTTWFRICLILCVYLFQRPGGPADILLLGSGSVLFCVLICFRDPEGLRTFYYLVQDLKCLVFSLIGLHFKIKPI